MLISVWSKRSVPTTKMCLLQVPRTDKFQTNPLVLRDKKKNMVLHSPQVVDIRVSRAQCATSHATQKANHFGYKCNNVHSAAHYICAKTPLQHKWLWWSLISCPLKTTTPNYCLIYCTAQMQMRPPSTGRCSRQTVSLLQRPCKQHHNQSGCFKDPAT